MDAVASNFGNSLNRTSATQAWIDGNCIHYPERTSAKVIEQDEGIATQLYFKCLKVFAKAWQELSALHVGERPVPCNELKHDLSRLFLWGTSFTDGRLDQILDQSDEVRIKVIKLIGGIGDIVVKSRRPSDIRVRDTLNPLLTLFRPSEIAPFTPALSPNKDPSISDLSALIAQSKHITAISRGDSEEESDTSGSDDEDKVHAGESDSSDDEDGSVWDDLRFKIKCLMALVPTMEQTLLASRHAETVQDHVKFSISDAAHSYVMNVYDKFVNAETKLVERLGEANYQRHYIIRSKMEQATKTWESTARQDPMPPFAKDEHHSVFVPFSVFHDSGLGSSVPTQSQRAVSVASHTSFLSSRAGAEKGRLRVPSAPAAVSLQKPFHCYICGNHLTHIKTRVDWKIHVYGDLQPYICTFSDCKDQMVKFPTRSLWADHEFRVHRVSRSWDCPECPLSVSTMMAWEDHLRLRHDRAFSVSQLRVALDTAAKIQYLPIEEQQCPLCKIKPGSTRRAFIAHIGRHLEEIALAALPRSVDEGSEEDASVASDVEQQVSSIPSNGSESDPTADSRLGKASPLKSFDSSPLKVSSDGRPGLDFIGTDDNLLLQPDTLDTDKTSFYSRFHSLPGFPDLFGSHQAFNPLLQPDALDTDKTTLCSHTPLLSLPLAEPVIRPLPTLIYHTTDQLNPEGDEYLPQEVDEEGEKKVSQNGYPQGGRQYKCRTFLVPYRGDKLFMLATECARVLNYRDTCLLFNKNRSLFKIIASQPEKEDLIRQEILPYVYSSRQIALVTAKSMFRRFGSRVIQNGRRVRDDYWEARALIQGFTEEDWGGATRPGNIKARDAATAALLRFAPPMNTMDYPQS